MEATATKTLKHLRIGLNPVDTGPYDIDSRIKIWKVPVDHFPQVLPIRVPLSSTIEEYTRGECGKVTNWFNNAMIRFDGRTIMSFRAECFPYWKNGRSFVCELDNDSLLPIEGTVKALPLTGLFGTAESMDGRFLIHDDRLYHPFDSGTKQRMSILGKNNEVVRDYGFVTDFELTEREKNWSFISHDGHLWCIYLPDPHTVLRIDGVFARKFHVEPFTFDWDYGEIRGGATPTLHNGRYYHFFHSSAETGKKSKVTPPWGETKRTYYTGVIVNEAKPPFKPVSCSRYPVLKGFEEILVKRRPNEFHDAIFVMSAERMDDGWLLGFGLNDTYCCFGWVPDSIVEESLV